MPGICRYIIIYQLMYYYDIGLWQKLFSFLELFLIILQSFALILPHVQEHSEVRAIMVSLIWAGERKKKKNVKIRWKNLLKGMSVAFQWSIGNAAKILPSSKNSWVKWAYESKYRSRVLIILNLIWIGNSGLPITNFNRPNKQSSPWNGGCNWAPANLGEGRDNLWIDS